RPRAALAGPDPDHRGRARGAARADLRQHLQHHDRPERRAAPRAGAHRRPRDADAHRRAGRAVGAEHDGHLRHRRAGPRPERGLHRPQGRDDVRDMTTLGAGSTGTSYSLATGSYSAANPYGGVFAAQDLYVFLLAPSEATVSVVDEVTLPGDA